MGADIPEGESGHALVQNSQCVMNAFGYWPPFHDLKLSISALGLLKKQAGMWLMQLLQYGMAARPIQSGRVQWKIGSLNSYAETYPRLTSILMNCLAVHGWTRSLYRCETMVGLALI